MNEPELLPASLADIEAARARIAPLVQRTPLLPLEVEGPARIYLKLENLHPIGAFKVRPASSILLDLDPASCADGVITASSGNFGIAVAWCAARLGVEAHVVVPPDAPRTKLEAIRRHGATIHPVSFEAWWEVIETHRFEERRGFFVDGVGDPRAIAANGTIGLEILEALPNVDTILVPFGGGGLCSGVGSAVRTTGAKARVIACESETATPLTAAFEHGAPVEVPFRESFITGIGYGTMLPWIWPLARELVAGTAIASLEQTTEAMRLILERNHVVAEGAGAVPVAAALAGEGGGGTVVCVVSGGNVDTQTLVTILNGETPGTPSTSTG